MMHLPKFDNANITNEELAAEQSRLQRQADALLAATHLKSTLADYGTVSPIEGSYQYGLMVYPDLDLQVITSQQLSKETFAKLVSEVAAMDFVRSFSVSDLVHFSPLQKNRPRGYWLGSNIPFDGDTWGIDIWLQTAEQATGDSKAYQQKLAHITPKQTAAILQIKYHLIRNNLYGTRYSSVDVYDTVLDGFTSYEAFLGRNQ